MGILTIDKNALDAVGKIAAARVVQPQGDMITVITAEGTVMRTNAETISQYNRVARGVSIMQMREDDVVASVARFAAQDMEVDPAEQEPEDTDSKKATAEKETPKAEKPEPKKASKKKK